MALVRVNRNEIIIKKQGIFIQKLPNTYLTENEAKFVYWKRTSSAPICIYRWTKMFVLFSKKSWLRHSVQQTAHKLATRKSAICFFFAKAPNNWRSKKFDAEKKKKNSVMGNRKVSNTLIPKHRWDKRFKR